MKKYTSDIQGTCTAMMFFKTGLLVYLSAWCSASLTDPPTLTLPSGKITGKISASAVLKRNFAAFYSIPYAKPPIGQLRFKEPVPSEPWKGTLMATEPPPMCPQVDILNILNSSPLGKVVGNEDCLYLNVFTPQLPNDNTELMDVIFLIHGGGFVMSSGNHIGTDRLMDKDVVVVTMNYRLGPLGFLSTEDLVSPGNNGLKDQNLALKWAKDNIAYFGGDPNKITISGCSAGGASVQYQLLSQTSKGLFQKAIPESGSALNPWAFKEHPRKEAVKLASALGCPTKCSEAMVECLKQRPADHIVLKQKIDIFTLHPEFQFVPSLEPPHPTAFLDKTPKEVIANGEASDVPILSSFSQDEGLMFVAMTLGDPKKLKEIEENWKETVAKLVTEEELSEEHKIEIGKKFEERYLEYKPMLEAKRGLVKMMSDWGFNRGIEESTKMMAKVNKAPIYSYQFAYRGKINFTMLAFPSEVYQGVNHCEQTLYATPFMGCQIAEDEPMLEFMINLTMRFIKGEPMAENWKPVKDGLPKYSLFKISSTQWNENVLEEYDDFSNAELWKSLKRGSRESHQEL